MLNFGVGIFSTPFLPPVLQDTRYDVAVKIVQVTIISIVMNTDSPYTTFVSLTGFVLGSLARIKLGWVENAVVRDSAAAAAESADKTAASDNVADVAAVVSQAAARAPYPPTTQPQLPSPLPAP